MPTRAVDCFILPLARNDLGREVIWRPTELPGAIRQLVREPEDVIIKRI